MKKLPEFLKDNFCLISIFITVVFAFLVISIGYGAETKQEVQYNISEYNVTPTYKRFKYFYDPRTSMCFIEVKEFIKKVPCTHKVKELSEK